MLHDVDVTAAKGTRVHGDGRRELFLSAEDWTEGLAEAYKGVDDVAYFRLNGERETLGPTGGDYNVLVTPDGEVFWVHEDCRHYCQRGVDWPDGFPVLLEIPIGPTTQGMSHWDEATRKIVWMDEVLRDPRPITRAFRHRGYTFGPDPDADRILAQKPDGSLWVVADCYTPVGAKGRLTPNGAVCAISLPSQPNTHKEFAPGMEPYFVPEQVWQPWTPPVIVPAPPTERPVIRRVVPNRHLGLGAEATKPRGTWVWSYAPGVTEPVMEGIGRDRRDIDTVPVDHPMRAVWWTRDDNASQFERDEAEREADRRKCALWVYCDRPGFDGISDAARIGGECAQQAYSFDNAAAADVATRASLLHIQEAGLKAVLVGRADQTTSWRPDQVDDMLPRLVEMFNDFSCVTDIAMLHRGYAAGANDWPGNRLEWWKQLIADNPAKLPEPVELPVEDKPADPGRSDDDGTNGRVAEWVAVGAGIVAVVKYAKPIGRAIKLGVKKLKFW